MEKEPTQTNEGGCLCGAVRYEVNGAPIVVAHCHCEACQRASGAGHSTAAMFPDEKFKITGSVAEYKYRSDNKNEVTRVFCPICSSPIWGRNSGMVGYVSITLGTLDDSSGFEPEVSVFACNRKAWDVMDECLPAFEAQPDWKPEAEG